MPITNSIIEPIIDPTTQGINKYLRNNSEYLKKSARTFLSGVRKIINNYSHIRVLLKSTKTGTAASLSTIYESMKTSTQVTRECIKLQYDFETALNNFLGREIQLLYIDEDGKMLYANELNAAKVYQTAVAGKSGKGTIQNLDKNSLTQFPQEIADSFKDTLNRRQNLYTPIRNEVVNRWTDNHNSDNVWVKMDPSHLNTFYWIASTNGDKKEWDWSKSINRGHIYETYAHLIWEEKKEITFNPSIELDIGAYWNYMQNHNLLNSVAGIVKGDVSFFLNPAIQFAVKSGSFNTAAMGPYIDVAYQLSYGTIEINRNMVLTLLDNITSYSNGVRKNGLEFAEKKLKELIPKTM